MKRNLKTYLKTYFTLSLVFLLSLSVFTGCDFFRRLAGRPTSDDIEIKRRAIADEKAEHARNLELLEISREAIKDSLARAVDILLSSKRFWGSSAISRMRNACAARL